MLKSFSIFYSLDRLRGSLHFGSLVRRLQARGNRPNTKPLQPVSIQGISGQWLRSVRGKPRRWRAAGRFQKLRR